MRLRRQSAFYDLLRSRGIKYRTATRRHGPEVFWYLNLANEPIHVLPAGLTVHGFLVLNNTPIAELPDDLTVHGALNLTGTGIRHLPNRLVVDGDLNLCRTAVSTLPPDMRIGGGMTFGHSKMALLPDGLRVHGLLDLSHTPMRALPQGLHVEGDLDLRHTSISELPTDLHVTGTLHPSSALAHRQRAPTTARTEAPLTPEPLPALAGLDPEQLLKWLGPADRPGFEEEDVVRLEGTTIEESDLPKLWASLGRMRPDQQLRIRRLDSGVVLAQLVWCPSGRL